MTSCPGAAELGRGRGGRPCGPTLTRHLTEPLTAPFPRINSFIRLKHVCYFNVKVFGGIMTASPLLRPHLFSPEALP